MADDKNKKEKKGKELSLNSLKKVTGGSGLKKVKFEETHDITEDVKKRKQVPLSMDKWTGAFPVYKEGRHFA